MCKTQFHTMYATVICGVCQQQPKKYSVLEFLRGADGYENGGMTNHGHHHTMYEAEAQAAAVRATSKGRVQVVPLADAAAYLD